MEHELSKAAQIERLLDIGLRLHQQGSLGEAEEVYREILRADFQYSDAWHLLGVLALRADFAQAAIELISEAVTLDPEQPIFRKDLGNAYRRLGHLDMALRCYGTALFLKPDYVEAQYNKATVLREDGELDAAVEAYRTALRLKPDDVDSLNDLGGTLRRQGEHQGAIDCYRAAIELDANEPGIHVNLGQVLEERGDQQAALSCYQRALELKPDHTTALLCWADLRPFTLDDRAEIERIEALLSDKTLLQEQIEHIHRVLGKAYDDCGLFDRAFEHYRLANTTKRERDRIVFDRQAHADFISRVITTFDARFFAQRNAYGIQSELPVFLIGMPHSGKSELGRVLAAHPRIRGAGDLTYFEDLSKQLPPGLETTRPYPDCAELIDVKSAERMAEIYVEQLRTRGGDAERIVDTAPNYAHVGLIALLFPNARIVHCQRHPLDISVAIYFKCFAWGQAYAYDLKDIAACYREYARLMGHWQDVLGDRMLTVAYEDLVADEARARRELVQFCGLQWDGLDMMPAPVLSDRFVNYWRNFEDYLGELKSELGY